MTDIQNEIEKEVKAQQLAGKIIKSVQQEIIAYMPYLSHAVMQMQVCFYPIKEQIAQASVSFGSDGVNFYGLASIVLQLFEQQENQVLRLYLHSMMHCLFTHMFTYDRFETQYWDLAADMAAENVILDLHWKKCELDGDDIRRRVLNETIEKCGRGNAETIYDYLCMHAKERNVLLQYTFLFRQDCHDLWRNTKKEKNLDLTEIKQKWNEIEKKTELSAENYERARGLEPGTISRRFSLPKRKREDYTSLLRKFMVNQEEIHTNPDSFDYIYYTYGLQLYENMPLIEPLEYRVNHQIESFAIAIDTSGSTQGKIVQNFIAKTYDILTANDIFTKDMHVVLLQCDAKIQEEIVIHNADEMQLYLQDYTIKGYGGTDFRPVFARIEELKNADKLPDFRGLLYFTDGIGKYPKNMPSYQTAFVMPENQKEVPEVPSWAIQMKVSMEELER